MGVNRNPASGAIVFSDLEIIFCCEVFDSVELISQRYRYQRGSYRAAHLLGDANQRRAVGDLVWRELLDRRPG